MKKGDLYQHFKGGIYTFHTIAQPIGLVQDKTQLTLIEYVRYHEDNKDLALYDLNGVTIIDHEVSCVIYESAKKWAREVDDFFGVKEKEGQVLKKFVKK